MKLQKTILLFMVMLAISVSAAVGLSYSANLGLLVKNSASLDAEEQAARNFAVTHGFSVTELDPSMILDNPSILDNFDGFWAANNSAPSGFDNPTISAALKSQLEGGKGLLITWYGNYMAQYLGLGTASLGSSWNPVVSDHEYWVDEIDAHPAFENLTPWIPPSGPPDDDSKLLFYVTPGYIPVGNIRVNWSVPYTRYQFAHIWASYGWCGQSFDPALQAQYGITGTCQRSVQISSILEAEVGSGSVIMGPCSMAGGDHWHWGEIGFQMIENMLAHLCSGGQPPPTIETQLVITPVNPIVRTGDIQNFQVTLSDDQGNRVAGKTINFTWEYTGLEPVENFNGSDTRHTDLLGQCNLNWFSKWAAFDGNVTVGMTASFSGDAEYMPSSFSTSIMVDATPAQIFARVFKDLNGSGIYEAAIDQLIPDLELTVSSAYNNYTRITTSTTGEYNIFIPKCAYELSLTVIDHGVEHLISESIAVSDFGGDDNIAIVEFIYLPPDGSVKGHVFKNDDTTQHVGGATVYVSSKWMENMIAVVTDAQGHYQVNGLIAGQVYLLRVCLPEANYVCQSRWADLNASLMWSVNFNLDESRLEGVTHCLDAINEWMPCLATAAPFILEASELLGPAACHLVLANDLCEVAESWIEPEDRKWLGANALILLGDIAECVTGPFKLLADPWKIGELLSGMAHLATCIRSVLEWTNGNQEEVAQSLAGSGEDMVVIDVHCRVSLVLVDSNGDSIFLDSNDLSGGSIEGEGFIFGYGEEEKLAIIIDPIGTYRLLIRSHDNAAADETFSLTLLSPIESYTYLIAKYENVLIGQHGACELEVITYQWPNDLMLDEDQDGNIDHVISPSSIELVSGEDHTTLSGRVGEDDGSPLLGVTVDVYKDSDDLWRSIVTDDSGYYHIDSIPNGNYTATVVTPLGYQADQETKEFTVHHVPVTVDFNLTKLDITPQQRSMGYWKHQVNVHLSGKGNAQESLADMSSYMSLIGEHFNNNLANPIIIFEVPQPATQTDSLEALQNLLTVNENETMNDRAKQHLIALMLNVVSLKLHQTTLISEDDATVSQAITFCNQLITDSDPANDEIAKDIADCINNGIVVTPGIIPLSTPNMAYKGGEDQMTQIPSLPKEFSLEQNFPNPFNPDCEIGYSLPGDVQVNLSVYNMLGQKVKILVDEYQAAGQKTVHWDGTDEEGNKVSSGVYFYRIRAGDYTEAKKMILMK